MSRDGSKRTLASLSACRCADMEVGCMETPSRLVAWGSEESEHERLGRATSVLGAAETVDERDEFDILFASGLVWVDG